MVADKSTAVCEDVTVPSTPPEAADTVSVKRLVPPTDQSNVAVTVSAASASKTSAVQVNSESPVTGERSEVNSACITGMESPTTFTLSALSLSVPSSDDTVHFMHHFGRYRERGYGTKDAIARTLHTAGRAMLVTSIVLCSGFLVLTLSQLNNFTHFGVYSSICIVLALMADFLLAPALMTLLNPVQPDTE